MWPTWRRCFPSLFHSWSDFWKLSRRPAECWLALHRGLWPDFRCYIITGSMWGRVGVLAQMCQSVTSSQRRTACVRIVFFRPLVPAGLSEEFVPSLKKENQHKKNKTKTQTSCHDSKNRFARTHSLAAHPQQWKLYFFLTPRGNVLPSVSAARRPAKGYFHAVVPQLPSRRLHCTPLIASLPKVFLDQTAEMAQVLFKA